MDSDQELVQRANSGDARAFEELYDRYRDWILRSARVVTSNDDLAAEVLQDVIVYWLSRFPGFVLQGKVTSFLYPCVRHAALEVLRKRGRTVSVADGGEGERRVAAPSKLVQSETSRSETSEKDSERADLTIVLQRAMEALPLDQREVLHLAATEGLAMAEIARALEIPVGTVKSRLHHALAKLREDDLLRTSLFE